MGPQTFEQSVMEIVIEHGVALVILLTPIIIGLFARDAISNRIGGWWFKRKGYYHEDQYVYLDGALGFIASIGNYETKFYLYVINEAGELCGKKGIKILNNELRKHRIEVLVPNAEVPKTPKGIYV